MTSDQIWLWARHYQGGGPTTELLRRIVHWLMKEPELDENALKAEIDGHNIHVRARKISDNTILKVTMPDGRESDLNMTEGQDGWLSADLENTPEGIYKFSDGARQKIISLGDTTTPEFSNVITTDEKLLPFVKKSQGGMIWAEDYPDFSVLNKAPSQKSGGNDWIGLKRNNSSSVISSEMKPFLRGDVVSLLGLIFGLTLWWYESRSRKSLPPKAEEI